MIIYKITNLQTNKIYIGQTIRSLELRWNEHLRCARAGVDLHLYEAIRHYGQNSFKIEVIDSATSQEELDKKEKYWIEYFNTLDPVKGYNNIEGGNSNPMFNQVILQKHNIKMRSKVVRDAISASMKKVRQERGFSEATREKISFKLKGNQHNKGKKRPASAIEKTAHAHFKKVYCVSLDGSFIRDFNSVKEAANWWNINYFNGERNITTVMNKIKVSFEEDRYINSLKWIYTET